MNSKRLLSQYLQNLRRLGVTHLPQVDLPAPAAVRTTAAPSAAAPSAASTGVSPGGRPGRRPAAPSAPHTTDASEPRSGLVSPALLQNDSSQMPEMLSETRAVLSRKHGSKKARTEALCQMATLVSKCTRCQELASTRTQTVFGVGNPEARIMLIGEAPGADEDAQGEPFVGRAGQLLNRILEASQLKREDVYICNVLRCRPPGNRNPLPQEAANCREYLDAQIHIVSPEYIICWGTVAAQNLLSEKRTVGKLRGEFHDYNGIKVMVTYHPSYLLRNPPAKKEVWEDMKFFMRHLGVELK